MLRPLMLFLSLCLAAFAEERIYVAARRDLVHVFSVEAEHRWLEALPLHYQEKPRGICADEERLYLSTGHEVIAWNWSSRQVQWRTRLPAEPADRLEVDPELGRLFVPSGFRDPSGDLFVLDSKTGARLETVQQGPALAHNAFLVQGENCLALAGRGSHWLYLRQLPSGSLWRRIGPFSDNLRPLTYDALRGLWYVNVDGLLGFEVADSAGRIQRVEAPPGPRRHPAHHECPSHGLALTPDGSQLWLVDSQGDRLLIYDTHKLQLLGSLDIGYDPGWVNFNLTGEWVYPSTGEIVARSSRQIHGYLRSPDGACLDSEKVLPIRWEDGQISQIGSQYGWCR
jgi:hypothetical protein